MKGGIIVEQRFKDLNGPIIGELDHDQTNAVTMNADLKKKLRVDRVRKMNMGNAVVSASVEDKSMPEWMKQKSLRDIEVIREARKEDILNSVFGFDGDNDYPMFNVTPGQMKFLPIPI